MKKQTEISLPLMEARSVQWRLEKAAYELEHSNWSEEEQLTLIKELKEYAELFEKKLEDARSKNLVYYAFDGIQPDLFMYPRKTINLSGIDYTKEYYDEVARCLREQGYPDHAEYVEKNTAELDKEYQAAYSILISESQEAELEKLKMDMFVDGGYGDESADSAALNRMAGLEQSLSKNHDE